MFHCTYAPQTTVVSATQNGSVVSGFRPLSISRLVTQGDDVNCIRSGTDTYCIHTLACSHTPTHTLTRSHCHDKAKCYMSYTHTLACSHTQMYTYPHTFIHTSSSITLKHSHYLHTHPCMHTHTNTLTQHIHISAYSNLVSRPSHLQFLFVCSMLK